MLNAVLSLDEPFRSAVALRFLEGRDVETVARLTRADLPTVRAWISTGVALLRTRCAG